MREPLRKPSTKITDEEIISLSKKDFSLPKIAKIKKVSYQVIYNRAKKLAKEGLIEIPPRGYALGLAAKALGQRRREEAFKRLADLLESNGEVVPISETRKILSEPMLSKLTSEHRETFQLIKIKWRGGKGKTHILPGSRFINPEYLGKKFIAFKTNRTGIVRFFMGILKEREYNQWDVKAITQWLGNFHLTEAEKKAIITHLGYEYKSAERMKIGKYLDRKPGGKRMRTVKVGEYYLATMSFSKDRFRIVLPKELDEELLKKFRDSVPIGIKLEEGKLIILLKPKLEINE